jgi:threonylcarbamoyladenosine tRNA methylthiotransferase CDKAL1
MSMKKNIEVRSFGCSSNFSEGENMKGVLAQNNFGLAADLSQKDGLVLNVCTVKGDNGPIKEIREALKVNPELDIVVGGCVTPTLAKTIENEFPKVSVTNTHHMDNVDKILQKTMAGERVIETSKRTIKRVGLPRIRQNKAVGIVTVCNGCLDRCAFCSTVQVKGKLDSYSIESIFAEVEYLVEDGCKEIWLTGQDAACYGFDIDTNLAKLVNELVRIPGDFRIRLGMGNPRHLVSYIDELVEVMKHPKVFKFLHLPVQAGSDSVLEGMKRQHRVAEYNLLVDKLRQNFDRFTLSTDIIVGYPNETEEDFVATLDLLKESKPTVCNRTRFVPRPGTVAAAMQDLHGSIKKDRSRRLTEVFKEIAFEENKEWFGWEGHIFIDEFGKKEGSSIGRNDWYKPVVVEGTHAFGTKLKVKIVKTDTFSLIGQIIT